MKKIAKRSVEVEVQPEDISPLELLQPGKLNKRTVMHLLRKVDVKKVGIAAGGAAVVLSAVSLTGRYTFYKGIVSGELKRQLAPVNKKLDELKAQNAELKAEVERLNAQCEDEKGELSKKQYRHSRINDYAVFYMPASFTPRQACIPIYLPAGS